MDPTPAPWRVIDSSADRTKDREAPLVADPAARASLTRGSLVIGAGAIALAVAAFGLAAGTGSGAAVVLDGGAVLDAASVAGASPGKAGGIGSGPPELVVEIVGAVDRPGVFRLPSGSRVGDLVEAAGGFGGRVDTGRASRELNLAAPLRDGDQVRVPSRDDEADPGGPAGPAGAGQGSGPQRDGPLDLNRATSAELEALPGIGPVTAGKIVASREDQPFGAIEDLRTRKLVGEKTFGKLRDLVTVR